MHVTLPRHHHQLLKDTSIAHSPPYLLYKIVRNIYRTLPPPDTVVKGIRRMTLPREEREVKTKYGPITVKVAFDREGKVINLMPEYESCRQAAEKKKVPLKEVYQEAIEKERGAIKGE